MYVCMYVCMRTFITRRSYSLNSHECAQTSQNFFYLYTQGRRRV